MITFYFIRHGQTQHNLIMDQIGQTAEEPLNATGFKQADTLGVNLLIQNINFDKLFCSTYERAIQTCNAITNKQPNTVIYDNRLREYSAGDMLGKPRDEVIKEYQTDMEMRGMAFKFPNGESLFEVEDRAVDWLNSTKLLESTEDLSVGVVSHGMTIKCLLHHIMKFDHNLTWRITLDNTSITKVIYKNKQWFIKSINVVL